MCIPVQDGSGGGNGGELLFEAETKVFSFSQKTFVFPTNRTSVHYYVCVCVCLFVPLLTLGRGIWKKKMENDFSFL
jgi:hypothetical protein